MKKHLLILLALALMAILLPGCTTTAGVQPNDLMAKIEPNQQTEMQLATILSSISPKQEFMIFPPGFSNKAASKPRIKTRWFRRFP